MFGLIISSRPVLTAPANATTLSDTQIAFSLPTAPSFSHIVIFLLPGFSFPPGTAAAIHIRFPAEPGFRVLGALGDEKPSAIFRVNAAPTGQMGGSSGGVAPAAAGMHDGAAGPQGFATIGSAGDQVVVVGISVEPVQQIEALLAEKGLSGMPMGSGMEMVKHGGNNGSNNTNNINSSGIGSGGGVTAPGVMTQKMLAQRIMGNAFAYLSSFGSDVIPLKAFQDWWKKFERKLDMDPTFLERDGNYD